MLKLLDEILGKLETLERDIDALDLALKPYGDGSKVAPHGRAPMTRKTLRDEAASLRMELADAEAAGDQNAGDQNAGDQKPPKDSQATKIVRDVEAGDTELWHSQDGDAYLTFRVGQHREHHRLRSGAARDYLSKLYFRRARTAASSSAIADAQATLSAMARFDGTSYPTYVRVAEVNGRIYLDLADPAWRVVEIDASGWRLTPDPPVRFQRPRGLRPLPEPVAGGSIADLASS